jgi:glycosyltransferase involved in cell wall biosynthesis
VNPEGGPLRLLLLASVRWHNACAAYAIDVAAGLRDRGHDVLLIVKPGGPVEAAARARGLRVEAGLDLTDTSPRRVWKLRSALRDIVTRFRPDLINPHRSEDHLFSALAARGASIPVVRTRGDVRVPRLHPANRLLYGRAAAHVACADFMPERFYAPLGIPRERVHVIRPGVDPRFAAGAPPRAAARAALGWGDESWVGIVGRLTAAKGHHVLLAAMARLAGRRAPHLMISGTENEISESALAEEADRLGIASRVRFIPPVEDVRRLLAALDVLAVPSVASEAISRVALEGLALGAPVVAARTNSLPEIVGEAGGLVPPGDPGALAAAIETMLADPERRARAAAEGPRRIARRYDRSAQIALTEALFRDVLARRRP